LRATTPAGRAPGYSGEQIVDEGAICEAGGARRRATPAEAGIWGAKLSSEHTFAPQIDEGGALA